MNVIFVTTQDIFNNLNSGGCLCSYRNYCALEAYAGKGNVETCIISKEVTNAHSSRQSDSTRYFVHCKGPLQTLLAAMTGRHVYSVREEKKLLAYINASNAECVFVDTSLMGHLIKKIRGKKTVCFMHNVEAEFSKVNVHLRGLYYLPSVFTAYINERLSIKKADKVICLTERDSVAADRLYGKKPDLVFPMTLEDRFDCRRCIKNTNKELVFIGSLFPANYDGILWFVDSVMSELPDYKLVVIGKDFEKERENLERKNVHVIGTVESIEQYYYRYSVVVMPIRYGSGIKIKTIEAMMYGRIIVASDEALEGYDTDGVEDIYRCNKKEEFVTTINKIFSKTLSEYSQTSRNLYLDKYQNKRYYECFSETIMNG